MVSRSSPRVLPSRRDRRREETITDIKTAARVQLAEGGPTGISLRAIARQQGMTPSAVHNYLPGRAALLDALIVDGWARWPLRQLAAQLSAWAQSRHLDIDPATALRGVLLWSRLHGFVSLEIAGNFASMSLDPESPFEIQLASLADPGVT